MMNREKEKPPLPEQDFFATFFIDWKKVETEFALETGLSLLTNRIEVARGGAETSCNFEVAEDRTRMRQIVRIFADGYASRVTRHVVTRHAVTLITITTHISA